MVKIKVLLVGHSARAHVIAETLKKNKTAKLFSFMKSKNPGIVALSEKVKICSYSDLDSVKKFAEENNIDFAFIGPEDPLNEGVVDKLQEIGIESIGPTKLLARLETSKSFTRELLEKYDIDGNPKFKVFNKENFNEIKDFFSEINGIVVKPDGLTGGKGVKVQGDHFNTKEEALAYCKEVLETHPAVVVEEKLDGEEFSLQCLTDGKTVIATPPVQDHKRAYDGDKGPNTGGMGAYSPTPLSTPKLLSRVGKEIIQPTLNAMIERGHPYTGFLYVGLMIVDGDPFVIEFNVRMGDPETQVVLPLLKSSLFELLWNATEGKLKQTKVMSSSQTAVTVVMAAEGYPGKYKKGVTINSPKNDITISNDLFIIFYRIL